MPMFRPNPRQQHLTDYWNALNRHAPDDELARLAALVAPADRAAIERARALHHRRRPDPVFVARLETTLMNAFPAATQITVALAPGGQPSPNGRFAPGPIPAGSRHLPQSRRRWSFSSVLGVALVVLLILASLGGIWLFNQRSNDSHILAPPDATPTTEASPYVPMYRGNAARTGVMEGPGIEGDPVELWQLELGGTISSAPAIVDGVLYIGVGDGNLHAFDAVTGATIWTFAAASSISSSPAVVDGVVYIGDDDGTLYALDTADGGEVWTFPGAAHNVSVAVVDGVVYTGSSGGFVHALDAVTGEERWRAPLSDDSSRSPAVADGVVYIGSADSVLHTFDAVTGEPGWTFQAEGGGLIATTAIADGVVYQGVFGGDANAAYALDAATGEVLWQFQPEAPARFFPPAIGDGLVYFVGDTVYALDATTGEEVWSFTPVEYVSASPVLVGETLYVAPRDGFVYALDAATGAEIWRFAVEGQTLFGPTVSGGIAYLGTTFGHLYAIGDAGTATLAALTDATPSSATASPVATPEIAGNFATFLWETSGGDTPFDQPGDPTIDPDGNIWISNGQHNQFEIFAPDGTWIESWGVPGTGEGEFDFTFPRAPDESYGAIAFALDGSFYVSDMGNQRIQHFDANRQFQFAWGEFGSGEEQFVSPFDIELDSQGNVWVVDSMSNIVKKFTANGDFLLQFGGPGREPGQLSNTSTMAIAPDDTVWVADGDTPRIQQWDNEGNLLAVFEGDAIYGFWGIAIDAAGRVFFTDFEGGLIHVIDSDGTVIAEWGQAETGLTHPDTLVFDGEGRAYILDYLDLSYTTFRLVAFELHPLLADEPVATPVS